MLSNETKSLIHLNLIQGVGPKTLRVLLALFGSAEEALLATPREIEKIESLSPALRTLLIRKPVGCSLEKELELIEEYGCQVVTQDDAAYPQLLKAIADAPPVLYVKGQLKPEDALSISLVGSRSAKDYGRQVSRQFSYQLAQRGVTVVSGLAQGVDTNAHRGALDGGGRTIAVMGSGLSLIYPASNDDLAAEIAQSGALISEFPMGMQPMGKNFPRRNRIISGLTLGTVVVEASNRSGALITAQHAADQGREVFAVPGSIFSELSTGTHRLINEEATLIHSIDELLQALPQHARNMLSAAMPPEAPIADTPSSSEAEPSQRQQSRSGASSPTPTSERASSEPVAPPPELTDEEKTVFAAIEAPSTHIDVIVRTTQLPIGKVSSVLLMLELKGVVQQLPGKQFTH